MAMTELSTPKTTSPFLHSSSRLSLSSKLHLSNQFRHLLLPPLHTAPSSKISCSVSQNNQAPVAVQDNGSVKTKKECYGVFLFGPDQPIALKLLGSERSIQALEGVAMELEDSLFPLLREVDIGTDPYEVFQDVEWALLIGAKPRGPGMERAALLDINGQIFAEQGKALNAVASPNVKVLVVGNPCNTNALICLKNAPNIPAKNFHALTRLDENRAKCQLALKAGVFYDKVSNMTIWGNHSTTQVPDFLNARINGRPVKEVITDHKWLEDGFTESVQKRGGLLIQKWGRSSAASTAVSIVDAIKSLVTPTPEGDWFSTGVYTNGNPYGIAEDLVFSMPCRSKGDGDYELVKDVEFDDYLRNRIAKELAFEILLLVLHVFLLDVGEFELAFEGFETGVGIFHVGRGEIY
ncbi:hypothetical protein F2Q69_00019359 [Brassica cretica]|uniref:Malate dehydrogenase [NADP], chloroplastic n=1 Tax=Brassica cretica TaxID=69181 RepID=A0A8S9Q839_BRACR|nr:hypothetical protein F2Q69_00019359 [Brassica cretica]